MDIKTFDKASTILKAIDQLNAEKTKLRNLINNDGDNLNVGYIIALTYYIGKIDEKIKEYKEEFIKL